MSKLFVGFVLWGPSINYVIDIKRITPPPPPTDIKRYVDYSNINLSTRLQHRPISIISWSPPRSHITFVWYNFNTEQKLKEYFYFKIRKINVFVYCKILIGKWITRILYHHIKWKLCIYNSNSLTERLLLVVEWRKRSYLDKFKTILFSIRTVNIIFKMNGCLQSGLTSIVYLVQPVFWGQNQGLSLYCYYSIVVVVTVTHNNNKYSSYNVSKITKYEIQ